MHALLSADRPAAFNGLMKFMLVCLSAWTWMAHAQAKPTYAEVGPLFAQRCVMCHSGAAAPAGLRLDSLDAVLKGSAKGPVVMAGMPQDSELVHRLRGTRLPRMPMTGPPFLSDAEIALVEGWIAAGMPSGTTPGPVPARVGAQRPRPGEPVTYLHVAPIFATRCAKCHTDNGLMGPPPEGLRLTSYASTLDSGNRARVVPGHPGASELLRRIRGQALPRMPFDGPPFLDREETQLIESWIAQGTRNADGVPAAVPAGAVVRLHGTLSADGTLDGLPLVTGPRTRVDKNPRPEDYVEVRGRLDAAGQVGVERLRAR